MLIRRHKQAVKAVIKTALIQPKTSIEMDETATTFNHSKTEINRMTTAELHELAKSLNVANEAEMSGANLKEYFINTYNL
jgi:transcription initiation factor TFIIIB Brf1 subunit/transcription initiation factor TFIIB